MTLKPIMKRVSGVKQSGFDSDSSGLDYFKNATVGSNIASQKQSRKIIHTEPFYIKSTAQALCTQANAAALSVSLCQSVRKR